MQLEHIAPRESGRFLRRYDLFYRLTDGSEKCYEMVSRVPVASEQDLSLPARQPDGVVLILLSPDGSRVLLNREFRPAVGQVVYNFPAGLLNPGETPQDAAKRELWEETGLILTKTLGMLGPSYGSVGLSNETALVVFGCADDTAPFGGNHDPLEEIFPCWVSRSEAPALLSCGAITARVQLFLALWAVGSGLPPLPDAACPKAKTSKRTETEAAL